MGNILCYKINKNIESEIYNPKNTIITLDKEKQTVEAEQLNKSLEEFEKIDLLKHFESIDISGSVDNIRSVESNKIFSNNNYETE